MNMIYVVMGKLSPIGATQNSMAPVGMQQQKLLTMLFLVIFCGSFLQMLVHLGFLSVYSVGRHFGHGTQ